MDLLRQYAIGNSDAAFAALVSRHVDLVYSAALRKTGNSQAAEDITQAVFIILAQKAGRILDKTILPGWLYQTARLTASGHLRRETRRVRREQEAFMQTEPQTAAADETWEQLAPLLDDAMGQLGDKDRAAVVLRFFGGNSFAEVAAAVGVSENAAKKRVSYALEKLHRYFARRGVSSTTAAIAGAISAHSVQAAPMALAKSVTAVAVAKGAATGSSTLTLIKGALTIMAWTKVKTAVVVGVAALLAAGTTTVVVKQFNSSPVESYFTRMESDYLETAPALVLLRPSRYANRGSYCTPGRDLVKGKVMRRGAPFTMILFTAYGFGPEQMVLPRNLPRGQFDLLLTVPTHSREALREEIKKQFGLVAHPETRDTDVLVLKITDPNTPGLKISKAGGPSSSWPQPGRVRFGGYKMSDPGGIDLAHELGMQAGQPVIDETGLIDAYDIDFH
jgi:RNA polymerase sigma factor (sigma-70 family)